MAKGANFLEKYQVWIDGRTRYHLSHAPIQMARALSMNPRKFGKIANHKQERWKAPLPVFIEGLYHRYFDKARPEAVRCFEQLVREGE